MSNTDTGLSIVANAEFGQALLAEAKKANQDKLKDVVISKVSSLLTEIEDQKREVTIQTEHLSKLAKMVEALQSGAFSVTQTGQIEFNDAALMEVASWRYRCSKCGNESFVLSSHKADKILNRR